MKLFWLLACTLLFVTAVNGQEFTFQGNVTDLNDRALPGVTVHLNNNMIALCDDRGTFSVDGITDGRHRIEFRSTGYHTYSDSILIHDNIIDHRVVLTPSLEQPYDPALPEEAAEMIRFDRTMNIEFANKDYIMQNIEGSLMQSLDRLPGVDAISIGPNQSKPLIRGLGFNRASVIEYGIKHQGQQWGADHGLETDQYAAERIEIIKGPASLRYGSDALGGAINLLDPELPERGQLGGSALMNYRSNNNTWGGAFNMNGRAGRFFADGRFTYMSSGDFRVPTDTVTTHSKPLQFQGGRVPNTAAKLTGIHVHTGYKGDDLSSVFHIGYVNSISGMFVINEDGTEARDEKENADDPDRDIGPPYHDVTHLKVINRSVLKLENQVLKLDLGYQQNLRSEWRDYSGQSPFPSFVPEEATQTPGIERGFVKHTVSINLSDEIEFDLHQITIGASAEHQQNTSSGWSHTIPDFRQFIAGAYVYDHIRINERLLLQAGFRIDLGNIRVRPGYSKMASTTITGEDSTFLYYEYATGLDRTFGNISWSLGMNYNTEQLSIKGHFGKSFRMPLAQELSGIGHDCYFDIYRMGDSTLLPEQLYQLDLTIEINRTDWAIRISPFINYFTNFINLQPILTEEPVGGSVGQVYSYREDQALRAGGEIQAQYRIIEQLRTGITAEYIYSHLLSREANRLTFPFSPSPSLTLNLNYRPEWKEGIFYGTFISADFKISAPDRDPGQAGWNSRGYQVMNLSAGTKLQWGNQPLEIYVQVKNLFNTKYLDPTSYYSHMNIPEPGRNLIISLKVPFEVLNGVNR